MSPWLVDEHEKDSRQMLTGLFHTSQLLKTATVSLQGKSKIKRILSTLPDFNKFKIIPIIRAPMFTHVGYPGKIRLLLPREWIELFS